MKTAVLHPDHSSLAQAVQLLTAGEIVAFPTETVYGLGALLNQPTAIQKIYTAKGRPSDNPLIIHVPDVADVWPLLGIVTDQQQHDVKLLADTFWPGPLTLILPKNKTVSDTITADLPSLAIRVPNHPVAQSLLAAARVPIVAPSANTSGKPSPTTAQHVLDDLDGNIAAVIDGGQTNIGIESTVLDLTHKTPVIVRPGHITRNEIARVLNKDVIELLMPSSPASNQPAISPGIKYRHYAPNTPINVFDAWPPLEAVPPLHEVLFLSNTLSSYPMDIDLRPLQARTLFAEFRTADQQGKKMIVIVTDPAVTAQTGLMNRILKAAA